MGIGWLIDNHSHSQSGGGQEGRRSIPRPVAGTRCKSEADRRRSVCVTMTMVMSMVKLRKRPMQTIKASEFKAKCLALMDEVARTGRPILITKNGRPVAELRAHSSRERQPAGVWKGKVMIKGDIISPLDVDWEALR